MPLFLNIRVDGSQLCMPCSRATWLNQSRGVTKEREVMKPLERARARGILQSQLCSLAITILRGEHNDRGQ